MPIFRHRAVPTLLGPTLLLSMLLGVATAASAQSTTAQPSMTAAGQGAPAASGAPDPRKLPPAAAAPGFYAELGGAAGVKAIVAEFVSILLADKRVAATFEGVDLDRLHAKLGEQFCFVSGGPCKYTGKDMAEVHEDLKATNAQFNATVEDLQLAMERNSVPSRIQNRLLARLAPTQHSIVTR